MGRVLERSYWNRDCIVSMNPFKHSPASNSLKCSWDGRSVLQSVERLDVSIGRFVRVSDMHCARASPAIAVLDGFLYAIGGFDGNDWLSDVSLLSLNHCP